MPQTAVQSTYTATKLLPLYQYGEAMELDVNLAPSLTYPKGQVLGQITSAANDVQTITPPGSSTYTLTFTNPLTGTSGTTTALAFNAVDATVQAALQSVVTSTGGGTVTVSSLAATFSGALANTDVPLMTASAGSVAHTTIGRSAGTYGKYNDSLSDGTNIAKCILPYDCATDGSGRVTLGGQSGGGIWGETTLWVPAYFSGYFDTSKLTGLDAAGVVDLGRLIAGSVSSGILCVTGV